jgi:cytochrome bd-type quinol oxidase subunit 2
MILPRCVQNMGVLVGESIMIFIFILACIPKVYNARVASGVFNETLTMVVSLQIVFMTTMLQGLAWTARDMPPFGALLSVSTIGFEAIVLTIAHLFPFLRALHSHRMDMDPHNSSMHNMHVTGTGVLPLKKRNTSVNASESKQHSIASIPELISISS